MKLIFNKIKRNKQRYISIVLALIIIQSILFFTINIGSTLKQEYFPETIFELDQVYDLKILLDSEEKTDEIVKLTFTPRLIEDISNINGIVNCGGFLNGLEKYIGTWMINSKFDSTLSIFHIDAGVNFQEIHKVELLKGTFLNGSKSDYSEVLLTETSAKHFGVFDKALPFSIVLPKAYNKGKGNISYNVCGIIKDLGYYDQMNQNKEVFPLITPERTRIARIQIGENTNPAEIEAKLNVLARKEYGHLNPKVEMVLTKNEVNGNWERSKSDLIPKISIIPLMLFYSLIALFGLFWNNAKHKKVDFGVMRAIGFNRTTVFSIVISEALLMAAISALFNLFVIFNFKGQLNNLADKMPKGIGIYESWLMSALGITILILLASVVPAIKTTRIHPAEALADE